MVKHFGHAALPGSVLFQKFDLRENLRNKANFLLNRFWWCQASLTLLNRYFLFNIFPQIVAATAVCKKTTHTALFLLLIVYYEYSYERGVSYHTSCSVPGTRYLVLLSSYCFLRVRDEILKIQKLQLVPGSLQKVYHSWVSVNVWLSRHYVLYDEYHKSHITRGIENISGTYEISNKWNLEEYLRSCEAVGQQVRGPTPQRVGWTVLAPGPSLAGRLHSLGFC